MVAINVLIFGVCFVVIVDIFTIVCVVGIKRFDTVFLRCGVHEDWLFRHKKRQHAVQRTKQNCEDNADCGVTLAWISALMPV